ncbi:MAG: tyrosine-type recombinase/integrase [Alphaproteobacteria bacterium]
MPSHKINFTKPTLAKLAPAESGKRTYYYDETEKGLVLDVTKTGAKSFYLYQRINGKPERVFLGRFPDISIENARKMAREKKGKIAEGKNPQNERRALRAEMTFKELFDLYMERYSKPHKRSWKYDEREINKFLPHWFNRKISSIRNDEVLMLHKKIGENNGIYAANRLLERIRSIYNKAIEWGYDGLNPALKIKKFKEKSRDRFLSPDELPRFFEALEKEENISAKNFILMSLFTGARKSNTLAMAWNEIDFNLRTWHIDETKNGESLTLPLPDKAIELLQEIRKTSNSEWVFPSPVDKSQHLADPRKAWHRILNEAGIEDLNIHDLRRTFGSYQAVTGANSYIIQKSLGHKSSQSTAVYARLNLDPVRASINTATDMIMNLSATKK